MKLAPSLNRDKSSCHIMGRLLSSQTSVRRDQMSATEFGGFWKKILDAAKEMDPLAEFRMAVFKSVIIIVGVGWVVNVGAIAAFSTAWEVVCMVKEVTGGLSILLMATRA